jgi:hypothetical protein
VHYIRFLRFGDEIASLVFGQAGIYSARISSGLPSAQSCWRARAGAAFARGWQQKCDGIFQLQKVFYLSSPDRIIVMETKDLIQKEIEVFPEPYLEEILDFIYFLKGKASKKRMETVILSESVLAKDWLSPEEDEAWKNL